MSKDKITIDGVDYIRADASQPQPNGDRAVVVVDRGWIFAGDVTEKNGRIYLFRAVWVFRWERIGLDGVLDDPYAEGVDIRPLARPIDIPAASEIWRTPVHEMWGLEGA
jgi:hypothetical protein